MNEENTATIDASETAIVRYRRRVRIRCRHDLPHGACVSITDADTGEAIPHVAKIVLTLAADDINKAEITYYETDEAGRYIIKDGDVVERTEETADVDFDLSAFEVME